MILYDMIYDYKIINKIYYVVIIFSLFSQIKK